MSLVFTDGDSNPVHIPKRRDVFEFDAEVSMVFENMALRSIPLYAETHRVHAEMVKQYIADDISAHGVDLLDIGASTGVFFKMLNHVHRIPTADAAPKGVGVAVALDPSGPMLDKVRRDLPWVIPIEAGTEALPYINMEFGVVNASYVLQFMQPGTQYEALQSIANCMRPDSLLFLSHKEHITDDWLNIEFQRQYIQFRIDNGYTEEEISAKTEALKSSMWPVSLPDLKLMLREVGLTHIQETSRWLNFSSLVCRKQG